MISRRRFLSQAAFGMMATATAGCQPPGRILWGDRPDAARVSASADPKNRRLLEDRTRILGYPINMSMPTNEFFEWRRQLQRSGIGKFAYNNVGDPFGASPIPYNTHDYERDLVRDFGERYGFPRGDVWGFLSHSGTDSNMHGMYIGRTLLKARHGVMPQAYYTKEAHYSIQILQDLLGLDPVIVATDSDGAMDPLDLARQMDRHSGQPALVIATLGTTFKGAIDPLDRLHSVLRGQNYYLHLDAALFGGYLAYTQHAPELSHQDTSPGGRPRYDSIAISCHKFFGFPAPAGLFLITRASFEEFRWRFQEVHDPSYIHQVPGTITCSRDAVKPAEFHYFTTEAAKRRLAEDAQAMLRETSWLFEQMHQNLPHLKAVRANPLSNTIYFLRPGAAIVRKYSLATTGVGTDANQSAYAHVVVMPHADRSVLSAFLADLRKDSSAPG